MWDVVEAVSLQSTNPKAFGDPGSAPSSVENSVMEISPRLLRRGVAGSEEPAPEEPRLVLAASRGSTWVSDADFLRELPVPRLEKV